MNTETDTTMEAEVIAIYATLEEAKEIRPELLSKVVLIRHWIEESEWKCPSGPMLINGRWEGL